MRNKEIRNYNSERIKAELSTHKCSCFERIHRGQVEAELKKKKKEKKKEAAGEVGVYDQDFWKPG